MFKKNTQHQQPAIISAASELPEKQRKRLENSWAGTFYQQFFCRINEEAFAVLYADIPSRPNIAVNVLVGLEAMKAGFGWSDQELYESYCYNLQVRYALGYDRLGDGDFEIRTLYYFRERLSRYNAEKGINLLEKAFEQITDAQIKELKVRTGMQRMDSTQIASNIVYASRLQLLVESLQRVERILSEADKIRLGDMLAPYIQDSAGHYTYRVKGKEAVQQHLEGIGQTIQALLLELKPVYAHEAAYQVLERIFAENYQILPDRLYVKENTALSSDSLQSVDDLEATYRTKGKGHYKGYVVNISETCDPENELQLITKVQAAPNHVDDTQLLVEALPSLKKRTELETLYTDGGYGSPDADQTLQDNQVEQIQTAIRGRVPGTEQLHLSDFEIRQSQAGKPTRITCPQGQKAAVHPGSQRKGFVAHFEAQVCESCPLLLKCPAQKGKRDARWHLRFTQAQVYVSQRRRKNLSHRKEGRNLRAAVEGTVHQVKHPFPASKLPVRGRFRVTCMMIGSAMMSNVRRIQCCLEAKIKRENVQNQAPKGREGFQEQPSVSFFASLQAVFRDGMAIVPLRKLNIGC
jgi:hypothetical protein